MENVQVKKIDMIKDALTDYVGFTSGEKEYCCEHLSQWISNDNKLDTMINKLAEEKSLDAKPFLTKIGLI